MHRAQRPHYQRGGERLEGRLEIRPNGQACFQYGPDAGSACFNVMREGENYRFGDFVTRTVQRGVREGGAASGAYVRLGADS
ncbi:MAG: hypothetical protein NT015_17000 [Alphaproteobacteria bacterium]|nr:hypothetical protein [Alphaproteobacteria bacterium]